MNTPDIEWEKEFDGWANNVIEHESERKWIKNFITKMRTSRDTYWKERVEEIMKLDIGDCSPTRTALQALLDNLK